MLRTVTCQICVGLLVAIWNNLAIHAQTTPAISDWEVLPATDFVAAATALFEAQPSASIQDQKSVSQIAWNRFLADESFIADGDWAALTALMDLFASRRSLLVSGDVTVQQVDAKLAALQFQVAARLEAHPTLTVGIEFDELGELANTLANIGYSAAKKAELFVTWMAAKDWTSLPLTDRCDLYEGISADAVDRRHVSIRWTGSLTATATGEYTFEQLPQYAGADSQVVVRINGEEVLNSTDASLGPVRFQSRSIRLTAGQPIPIRVDMVHDVPSINNFSEGVPMVVLTWRREGGAQTIIPSSAFTPPEGFGPAGARGLRAEIFGDANFVESKAVRLDAALDVVSSSPPLAPIHEDAARKVLESCIADVLDAGNVAQADGEGNEQWFSDGLCRVVHWMPATQRLQLVETLLRTPEALAVMTPEAMGRLMQAAYMLPGDEHLDLVGEWALARPQPRTQPGQFPGLGEGHYQELNTDYYWLMGLFLQGPYHGDVKTLWDEYFTRPNGECNLAIAYLTAYATRENFYRRGPRYGNEFYDRVRERLDDETTTGDVRVTWLLARTFADEITNTRRPRLLPWSEYLVEARLAADSAAYEFWALQEAAVRYVSLGDEDRLDQLLDSRAGDGPEQQTAMAGWGEKAAAIAAANVELRAQEDVASQAAFVAELDRRFKAAIQRQDQAEMDRYQRLIETATRED